MWQDDFELWPNSTGYRGSLQKAAKWADIINGRQQETTSRQLYSLCGKAMYIMQDITPVKVNEPPLFFDVRALQPRWTMSVGRGRAIARCTSLGLICDMPRPCPWTSPTAESSNSRYFACAEYMYPVRHNSSSVTLLPGTR